MYFDYFIIFTGTWLKVMGGQLISGLSAVLL